MPSRDADKPEVRIEVDSPGSRDAAALIGALDADLALTYPRDVIFGLHEEDHDPAHMVFLVARAGSRAVGCAALRSLDDDTGEVKRMYVVPDWRRGGLARRLLGAVEEVAVARRHRTVRLETGRLSPPALALYRSAGYREIPCYGEYAGNDYSVCFEKRL